MNKSEFIKELTEKLNYDEEKCIIINSVIEDYFWVGKNNKEKIVQDLMEKLEVSNEEADNIYNTTIEIMTKQIKDKILHPFKKN